MTPVLLYDNLVLIEPLTTRNCKPVKPELKLRPYQEEGVAFLAGDPADESFATRFGLDREFAAKFSKYHKLLADDMGLGKTVQVIAAINRLHLKTGVIVCPATIKTQWVRELVRWLDTPRALYLVKTRRDSIPRTAQIIVVNYDVLIDSKGERNKYTSKVRQQLSKREFEFIVFDEAHYLKSVNASRTRALLGRHAFTHNISHKWCLTGTPVQNRPKEFYPILRTLAPAALSGRESYREYTEYFCRGYQIGGEWIDSGHSNVEELAANVKPFMLRRRKDDVLKDLPDKVESTVILDVQAPSSIDTEHIATVRRDLALAKLPAAVEYLRNMLVGVEKVVVFAHHRDVIEHLTDAFTNEGAVKLYGGMTPTAKQAALDKFIASGQHRMLVAQTISGGTGVDGLQLACNHCVFIEPDWSPGVMDQAVDRLRRIGQKDTVFVTYLVVENSLDTDIGYALDAKRNVINRLIRAKEILSMSIDNLFERAVVALESIAKSLAAQPAHLDAEFEKVFERLPAESPKPKKAAAKKTEVEAAAKKTEVEAAETPAPTPAATHDEVRKAALEWIKSVNDPTQQAARKAKLQEEILPMFGAIKIDDLGGEDIANCLDFLQNMPVELDGADI